MVKNHSIQQDQIINPVDEKNLVERNFLTTKQAAKYLGISVDQLYKLSSNNKIPIYSPTGGKIYLKVSDMDQWIETGRRATRKEINSFATNFLKIKNYKL